MSKGLRGRSAVKESIHRCAYRRASCLRITAGGGLRSILGAPELKLQATRSKLAVNQFAHYVDAMLPCVFVHVTYVDNNASPSFVITVCFA